MAKKNTPKNVETLTHTDDRRRNIPTAEYQSMMRQEEQSPVPGSSDGWRGICTIYIYTRVVPDSGPNPNCFYKDCDIRAMFRGCPEHRECRTCRPFWTLWKSNWTSSTPNGRNVSFKPCFRPRNCPDYASGSIPLYKG